MAGEETSAQRSLRTIDDQIAAWQTTTRLTLAQTYDELRHVEALRCQLECLPTIAQQDDLDKPEASQQVSHEHDEPLPAARPPGHGISLEDHTVAQPASQNCSSEPTQPSTGISFSAVERELDGRLHLLRARANSISKGRLRPLKALDLPPEIWRLVFETFTTDVVAKNGTILWEDLWADSGEGWPGMTLQPQASPASFPDPGLYTIRTARLVCRAFNEMVTPLMCPVLNISLSSSSIRHAQKLCQNEAIAKGVHCVQVWLQCYSKKLADRQNVWARSRYRELKDILPWRWPDQHTIYDAAPLWWPEMRAEGGYFHLYRPPHDEIPKLERRAKRAMNVLGDLALTPPELRDSPPPKRSSKSNSLIQAAEAGWKAYGEACDEQAASIKDGTFAKAIAALMASVAKPLALGLRTGNMIVGWPMARDIIESRADFERAMRMPHSWASLHELSDGDGFGVAKLLYQIPVACYREGVELTSFAAGSLISSYMMPGVWPLEPDEESPEDALQCTKEELHAAFSRLRQFKVAATQLKGFPKEKDDESGLYTLPRETCIDSLYRAALASPCLEDVCMGFRVSGTPSARGLRALSRRYPLSLALRASSLWTARLRRLDLRCVTLSHATLVGLIRGTIGPETEDVNLADLKVQDAQWTVIWDVLREQLADAKACEVSLFRICYDRPEEKLERDVLKKARLYVKSIIEGNPGPSERGSQDPWGW